LADNRRIFYLDINEAFDDEYGNLQADISFDGVHLKAAAYTMWYEYLKTHAAVAAQ
jgi:lysophospholipase L1-like esterase